MDFSSLIGPGLQILGGITGDALSADRSTGTTEATGTTTVTPELQTQIDQIFAQIPQIFGAAYPDYQGDRVAPATENRDAMDPFLNSVNSGPLVDRAQGINPYQDRINELMNMTPVQVQAPTLLGQNNAAGVSSTGGYNSADVTSMLPGAATQDAPWMTGFTQGQG
tara:strand:+ start:6347 stop:6844 length:498 start_codon:yes stop_codon:yes gene_type:complete